MLSNEQVQQYLTEGYTIVRNALPRDDVARLRGHVDELLANYPAGQRPEHADKPHVNDPVFMGFCRHPRLLDYTQDLIGPDIVLFSSHLIAKLSGDGLEVPWHQDAEYWALEPMDVATLWLAVDESVVENGCMRVIPGTHTRGPLKHHEDVRRDEKVLDKGLDPDQFDVSKAVDIELQPGDISFHAPYLVHGSTRNTSSKRRCGYTMRFMPATTKLIRTGETGKWWAHHPLYLVRGEDRSGNNRYENEPVAVAK